MSAHEMTVEALLRAHAPHAPESLRQRVFALEPKRRQSGLRSRRFALVVVPAALAVAVAAAVVYGIVGSGSKTPSAVDRQALTAEAGPAPSVAAAGKAAAPSIAGAARLQRTDASLALRVSDDDQLAHATTRATQIATALGGYAQSVDYHSRGSAVVELRVPTQNVKAALARLAGLGTIVSQSLSVTDLQRRLETQSAQIAQLRRRVAALQTALADPALPEAQKVLLQIKLAESKRALSQRLHARKGTVAAGTTARISLSIETKQAVVPVPHRGRVDRMLHSALGFLALEAMVALFALIVVSPFLLVGGAFWLRRRRSVDRLLAA